MNVDSILEALNRQQVAYLLIGGMNFLFRHQPTLTFDVDIWIEDTPTNRTRCQKALVELNATWGANGESWRSVAEMQGDWLERRSVYCVLTDAGPLDIFRSVMGLPSWSGCAARAEESRTPAGVPYRGLSDRDMLDCQLALEEPVRKLDRIRILRDCLQRSEKP